MPGQKQQPEVFYKKGVLRNVSPMPLGSNMYIFIKTVLSNTYVYFPAGIYLLKVNKGNTRILCEIYSKLTIKTLFC